MYDSAVLIAVILILIILFAVGVYQVTVIIFYVTHQIHWKLWQVLLPLEIFGGGVVLCAGIGSLYSLYEFIGDKVKDKRRKI
jgi:uncharacterized integral membrane protein